MPLNPPDYRQNLTLYWWIALASLLLSLWLIWMDPVINRDAIIYLRAADAYLLEGLAASQEIHGRPLLPLLMAYVHQLTGIPLLHAGLGLISLFYVILCLAFVATVRTLGGDRSIVLIAAIVILSHPWLNHTRSSIMREPAFLAFLMLSFRELLLYARRPDLGHQLRWLGYIVIASLFRFEGLFFAFLAPLALLLCKELPHRFRHCLKLLAPLLLVVLLIGGALSAYDTLQGADIPSFPGISHYIGQLKALPSDFSTRADEAAMTMLQFTARDDAVLVAVAALLSLLLLNICRALSWPWVLVLLWGARQQVGHRLRSSDQKLLFCHAMIGIFYLAIFVLSNRFMLERYSMQVVIFLMLLLPFALGSLWHAGGWRKYLVIVLLAGMSIDTVHNNDREKMFIVEATEWVEKSTPADASIVSNEKYIAYFSGREFDWTAIQGNRFSLAAILSKRWLWRDKDYLVMYIKLRTEESWQAFLRQEGLQELKSFGGGRKGRVVIVQNPAPMADKTLPGA